MDIREIPYGCEWYAQSCRLRQEVLRTPIGLALSDKDVAGEDRQFHVAAIEGGLVVGVMLLKPLENRVMKFRQVAVSNMLQGRGVGRLMMQFAESLARSKGATSAEMNARTTAQAFYEKLGYVAIGDIFTEVGLTTVKMVKTL